MIAIDDPRHLVVSLIPPAVLLWPTWCLAGNRQIHSYNGCPQASAAFIPCLKIIRTQSKDSFFEEGRHLWTGGQMQGLMRVLLTFSPLPWVQLVEKRSHGLECFLSLDKQKGGGSSVFSLTGHIKRPFWILLSGSGHAIEKDKHLSTMSGITEIVVFIDRVCVCVYARLQIFTSQCSPPSLKLSWNHPCLFEC